MMFNYGIGWGAPWGMLLMVVFWVLVILGVVLLVKALATPGKAGEPPSESALDILKKRYAKGEIGREEFEAKKKDLL